MSITQAMHPRSFRNRMAHAAGQWALCSPLGALGVWATEASRGPGVPLEEPAALLFGFVAITFVAWALIGTLASAANPQFVETPTVVEFVRGVVLIPVWLLAHALVAVGGLATLGLALLAVQLIRRAL